MKILIVGSAKNIAIEFLYERYLKELGADVTIYPLKDWVQKRLKTSMWFKLLMRANAFFVLKKLNDALLAHVEKEKPAIVWVFKGMYVLPETLKKIKKTSLLVNYNPDHPFVFSSRGSGNSNVTQSIPLYDLHLCYHLEVQKTLETKYHLKTAVLPFGFELNPDLYDELIKENEILKTCFLGNPDATRVATIQFIVENGFSVDVYGHGWKATELANNKNVTIFDAQYGEDFWRKLRAYRVQLNIFRKHNIGSHNMRTFEIPACGGIQLAPFSEEQAAFFKENEEIFFYRSNPELILQLNRLLKEEKAMIHKFRSNARLKSIDSGYSYQMRSKQVFEIFDDLLRNG